MAVAILLASGVASIVAQSNPCVGLADSVVLNFPHPSDCNLFILCIGSSPLERRCPTGHHFNSALRDCSTIETANCVSKPPINLPKPTCDLNTNFEIIAHAECTRFTICACGHAHVQECAPGLTFDAATRRCAAGGLCVTDPKFSPTCPPGFVGFLPHPSDCHHHFLCAGAAPVIRRCGTGLLFSATTRQCEMAATVTCPARSSSTTNINKPISPMLSFMRPYMQTPIARPVIDDSVDDELVHGAVEESVDAVVQGSVEEFFDEHLGYADGIEISLEQAQMPTF